MRRGFTIHHNGPPANCVGHPHPRCEAFWRAVRDFHVNDKGWSDIAYSFGVCHHGHRFVGRGWDRYQFANGSDTVGADDGDDSEWYTVLVFVGGDDDTYDNEPPTAQMVKATAELIEEGRARGLCGDRVTPHNFWKRKACPGPEFTALAARWDRKPSPLLTPTEDPFAMFKDLAEFKQVVSDLIDARLDARLSPGGADPRPARQAIFDLARGASILGGYLAWAEDAVQGDPVYWISAAGKWKFTQGDPLHLYLKAELDARGQTTNARRLPVAVLEAIPTIFTAELVELDAVDPTE
jgi:hypothetical protein